MSKSRKRHKSHISKKCFDTKYKEYYDIWWNGDIDRANRESKEFFDIFIKVVANTRKMVYNVRAIDSQVYKT